jgi:heme/copper-type cytochrome/quinol oxidase subunit 2
VNGAQQARIDFDAEDESRMASAATWGQLMAICTLISAVVAFAASAMEGFDEAAVSMVGVGVNVVLGISLYLASAAFRRVAKTDADDHGNLITGFRHLRTYFAVQGILLIIGLAFAALAITCGLGLAML